jgi:hypothetical protein
MSNLSALKTSSVLLVLVLVLSGCPYPPTDGINAASLRGVVADLASDAMNGRDEGTPGGLAAQDYLVNLMEACGMAPALNDGYRQPITTGDGTNLLARIPGSDSALSDRHIILSAHFDHVGSCGGSICNGAYDNATGVAAVMAVGCALAQSPTKRSILIALWDAEEPPTFLTSAMGSAFYAANPPYPLEKTDAVFVAELLGGELWPGYMATMLLGAEFAPALRDVVDAARVPDGLEARRAGLHLAEEQPYGQQVWSDYDAFRDRRVPFVMMSDGQNKRYHQVNDDIDGINSEKLAMESLLLLDLAFLAGNSEATFTYDESARDDAADVAAVLAILQAALDTGGIVETLGLSSSTRTILENDLSKVQGMQTSLDQGNSLFGSNIDALRAAAQRVMCLAGTYYTESICRQL